MSLGFSFFFLALFFIVLSEQCAMSMPERKYISFDLFDYLCICMRKKVLLDIVDEDWLADCLSDDGIDLSLTYFVCYFLTESILLQISRFLLSISCPLTT